jgi:hypothetical protein
MPTTATTTSVSLRLVRESRSTVSADWTPETAARKPDHFARDLYAELQRREASRMMPAQTERDLRKIRGQAVRGWAFDPAALSAAETADAEAREWAGAAFRLLAALPKGVLETPILPATAGRAAFTLRDAAGLMFTLPTTSEVRKGGKGE